MAQHFLLSLSARKLSLLNIAKMSDDKALSIFSNIRRHNSNPICPYCSNMDKIYLITTEMSINAMSVKRDLA